MRSVFEMLKQMVMAGLPRQAGRRLPDRERESRVPWSAACWRRWAAVQCCARPRSTSAGLPVQGAIRAKKELLSPELSREQGRRLRNPDILRYRCSLLFLELPLLQCWMPWGTEWGTVLDAEQWVQSCSSSVTALPRDPAELSCRAFTSPVPGVGLHTCVS